MTDWRYVTNFDGICLTITKRDEKMHEAFQVRVDPMSTKFWYEFMRQYREEGYANMDFMDKDGRISAVPLHSRVHIEVESMIFECASMFKVTFSEEEFDTLLKEIEKKCRCLDKRMEYLNKARDRWLNDELGGGQEEP